MKYKLGAIPNPRDPRDIPASAVQTVKDYPETYINDGFIAINSNDQLANGSCVGQSVAVAVEYFDIREGTTSKPSPRFIYGMAKLMDGYDGEGTYPRVGAKVVNKLGCATAETVPFDDYLSPAEYRKFNLTKEVMADAAPRKISGYCYVDPNIESIKAAIYKNKFVTGVTTVGNWNSLPVLPGNNGHHQTVWYGYETTEDDVKIYFKNSWGTNWGDRGNGYFYWSDYEGKVLDIYCYTDIPKKVLDQYKKKWPYKYFKPHEVEGLKDEFIQKLEKARSNSIYPFIINSGFRTKVHNEKIGGVPDSSHLTGLAADIRTSTNSERYTIITTCLEAGIKRIGIYPTHVHVDIDPTKAAEVIWHERG